MISAMLTHRFEEALQYAAYLHQNQMRKGTEIPYIVHLLAVTALVLEDGGDEDQGIAALLHDAVEDQGGIETLEEIQRRFGNRVATIVEGCTDAYEIPKPAWRPRKEKYIEHLRHASKDIRRVSLADKLHNARSIRDGLLCSGEAIWDRFNGGKEGTLWYYRTLVQVFNDRESSPMATELARVVEDMERIAASHP
jgi:(p)ppGpp synthase/HD superfamily hydrolase